MSKPITLALASLLLWSVACAGQPTPAASRPVPVPKDLLEGTRLIVKEAKCTVELPTGWQWMMLEKEKMLFCLNPKTFDTIVLSTNDMKNEMTTHQPESLIKNARLTMETRGGKLLNDKYDMIDLPNSKKSAHVTFQEVLGADKKFAYIYLAQTTDSALLKLHITAAGKTTEPPELTAMAKSIKEWKGK